AAGGPWREGAGLSAFRSEAAGRGGDPGGWRRGPAAGRGRHSLGLPRERPRRASATDLQCLGRDAHPGPALPAPGPEAGGAAAGPAFLPRRLPPADAAGLALQWLL